MKKKLLAVLLTVAMVATMVACGSKEEPATDAPAAEEEEAAEPAADAIELVVGGVTSQSAKDAVIKFGELVEEYSNGTITILDFPDNQLGNDEQRFEMTQTGECDISLGSTSSVAASYQDFYIYDVYYMFLNKDEVYNIGMRGEAAKKILAGLEEIGLKGLPFFENGFRNITTSDIEINTVEDVKGLKLRTMENAIHLAAWKGLGTNPTPMAFGELFTALQQGTVDGQENPLGIITGNKFEEVQSYCALTEHVYTPYYVVMNLDRWNSLTAEQQEAVEKAMEEAAWYQYEQSQKYEDEAVGTMEAAGCKVITLTDDAKLGFKAAADSADGLSVAKEMMAHPEYADELVAELEAARQ